MKLDTLAKGHRLEIGPGSVVLISIETDEMREYPSILDAYVAESILRAVKAMEKAFIL